MPYHTHRARVRTRTHAVLYTPAYIPSTQCVILWQSVVIPHMRRYVKCDLFRIVLSFTLSLSFDSLPVPISAACKNCECVNTLSRRIAVFGSSSMIFCCCFYFELILSQHTTTNQIKCERNDFTKREEKSKIIFALYYNVNRSIFY